MKKTICILILITICLLTCGCSTKVIVWDDIVLSDMLPEPTVLTGEIHANSSDDLRIDICKISDKQYSDYIEACKEKGFTTEAESTTSTYTAYNADGYKLRLSHYRSNGDMSINLEAPMQMSYITWPTGIAGEQLPVPKSTIGKFSFEYSDNFFVYIGNTSKTDYAEYVNACSKKGFDVDYQKGDNYYYADNSQGWHISVRYEGNNVMSIDIDAPKDDNNTSSLSQTANSDTSETNSNEDSSKNEKLDPNFKAAMDSYEKFMDDYIAFMRKFEKNPNDLSLITDYAKYMSDYADFVEDFEKWEDEDMNAAETAYYIEVQARVSKKLLEAAQ